MNKKADLHLHTTLSDGLSTPRELLYAAIKEGITVIAITDHNTIKPALIAREIARKEKLPVEVIIGEEVLARQGELIGLFLKKKIAHSLDVFETAGEIKAQGGIVIAPHPGRLFHGYSLTFKTITELNKKGLIDAIEIYNFWDHDPTLAKKRLKANKTWRLAEIGSSDSHHTASLGQIYTQFLGNNANDLKRAIYQKATNPINQSTFLTHRIIEAKHFLKIIKMGGFPKGHQTVKISLHRKLAHMIKLLKE